MTQIIRTPRLKLVGATSEMARAAADGDHARFAELLDAHVPPDWPPALLADAQESLAALVDRGSLRSGKLAWYVIVAEKHMLAGYVGFKGPPERGTVEIGFAMVASQQGKGFATEAVGALSGWGFTDPRVQRVIMETVRTDPASMKVAERSGFFLSDGGDGPPQKRRYELRREDVFGVR